MRWGPLGQLARIIREWWMVWFGRETYVSSETTRRYRIWGR